MNIIFWKNAALLLPETIEFRYVIGGCILLSLPTNWLKDFQARSETKLNELTKLTLELARRLPGAPTVHPTDGPTGPRTGLSVASLN